LFVTDGTDAGTHIVRDINPGSDGTSFGSMFAFGGKLYFAAYQSGWHTYVTDGTDAGTHIVVPGDASLTGAATNFLAADATHFYFTGDSGLFYSDGTDTGTVNIGSSRGFDINTTGYGNGQLLYRLYDDTNGYELWSTNGTVAGTHRLTDTIIPNSSNATGFVFSGGKVYFYADDGIHGANELFVTDGTPAGTHLLNDFNGAAGTSYGSNFAFDGKFYFTAYDPANGGWHTYVTNGSGTPHLIVPGDASATGAATNFLAADATHFFFTGDAGLFYSDGTDAGTHLIGDTRGYGNASVVNGVLYYQHYDDTNGYELWESNGTVAGTMRLTDTQVPNSSNPGGFVAVDNSPPTVANATVTAITDQQTNRPFQNVVIGDTDAPAQTLTVTVTPDDPAKGGFTTASLAASGFVGSGINGSYTFTGTAAQATAAIDALVYQPTANHLIVGASETMNFTIAINDGAGGSVVNHQTTITQTSANDAPVGVNDSASVNEDATVATPTPGTGVLSNDSDVDVGETPGLIVTGAHSGAAADTAVAASGTTTIHGTYGDLSIAANGTYNYTPNTGAAEALALGQTANEVFSYTVTDVHGANGAATLTFTITGQEDGPVAVADIRTTFEDATSSANTRAGGLLGNDTDVDTGETAALRIIGAHFAAAVDTAIASSGTTTIHGTYGDLLLAADGTYSYTPNTAAAEALPQGQPASDAFSYTIVDAQGQNATSTVTFNIAGTNDAPLGTGDGASVNEDVTASATTRATGVLGNDTDVDTGETATLRVSGAHFGAVADTVVGASGTVIHGLYGDLSIAANGTYSYTPNTPAAEALALGQTASDVFSYTVADVNNGTGTATLTFNITGQNDAPTATLASGMNATEQVTYDLKGKVAIGDVDSGNPVGTVTLSVGYGILHLAAGTSGATIDANDAGTVTVSGTLSQLSALFNSDATSVVTYFGDTDTPPASVTLNVAVTDDHDANGATSATIGITPVDDPAVAMNDTNAVIADQAILGASVFGNDHDVDGPALQVAAVNGVAGNVGSQFTLPSGALLTMRANGTYDYNPNHAFDSLTAITGATNRTGTDTFTYGLVNGNTAAVTITVTGSPNSTAPGYGSAGDDTMTGTAHDDFLDLRQGGNDTASGAGGNDSFYLGAAWNADDQLDGGTGIDHVIAQGNTNLTLSATSLTGIEQLTLLTGSDPTSGDAFGFPYSYQLTSNDANVAAGQQFTVQGGSLHATEALTFNGSAEIDGSFLLYGGLGNDALTGGQQSDTLYGGGGNDRLNGGLGADTMDGGAGTDTFVVDNAGDVVVERAGEGTDTVEASVSYALSDDVENLTLTGTDDITATGNSGANIITGNAGNNSLVGNGGADTLIGGAGDDIYTVSDSSTVIVEAVGGGNDILKSSVSYVLGAGVDVETSRLIGTGNINLTGNADHQILIGNTGNNVIDGGGGGDRMKGGAGDDTFIVRSAADVIVEIAGDGDDTVKAGASYTLGAVAQIEHLTTIDALATSAINLTGNDYSHDIQGNAGVNVLTGGSGNDTISGNGGADTLVGGAGDDIYAVTDSSTVIVESVGGGNDTIKAFVSYVLGAGVDVETTRLIGSANLDLTGNADHQILIGNLGNNVIDGGGGGDRMKGAAGDDTFVVRSAADTIVEVAGDGNDTVKAAASYTVGAAAQIEHLVTIDASAATAINLTGNDYSHDIQGNAGANVLTGGTGDDVLQGLAGNDTLFGGAGADHFVFDHGTGQDMVGDFVSGTDKLDLSAFGFANFAAVQAATHDVGGNAVIDLGGGDSVTLSGFLAAQLQSGDVILGGGGGQVPLKADIVDVQRSIITHVAEYGTKGILAPHFHDYLWLNSLPATEYVF
jgi:VCBS repeat-containing protein/ELWxxDGT repeat protein